MGCGFYQSSQPDKWFMWQDIIQVSASSEVEWVNDTESQRKIA
jgi:hypothetical protein